MVSKDRHWLGRAKTQSLSGPKKGLGRNSSAGKKRNRLPAMSRKQRVSIAKLTNPEQKIDSARASDTRVRRSRVGLTSSSDSLTTLGSVMASGATAECAGSCPIAAAILIRLCEF